MTAAPPVPGTHTILVDPRLLVPGRPLFDIPAGYTIKGVDYPRINARGLVEFRLVVGKKVDTAGKGIDKLGVP